jgi:hypothetical protein
MPTIGRPPRPREQQITLFWSRFIPNEQGCWIWQLGVDEDGYGKTKFCGEDTRISRLAWILARGPIPPGLCVLHSCDVRRCANPEHLFLGTNHDNTEDMFTKNRQADQRGEHNGGSKLTWATVYAIRQEFSQGVSIVDLALKYKTHRTNIHYIVTGKTWRKK